MRTRQQPERNLICSLHPGIALLGLHESLYLRNKNVQAFATEIALVSHAMVWGP